MVEMWRRRSGAAQAKAAAWPRCPVRLPPPAINAQPKAHPMPSKKFVKGVALACAGVALLYAIAMVAILVDGMNDELHKAEATVVLGNEVLKNGQPSARLRARLQRALDLYRQDYFPRIIVSGGTGKSGHDEAVVMAQWLIARGVPAARVIRDSHGVNTWATAANAAQILREGSGKPGAALEGARSILVVSQHFHIARCKLAFRRAGIFPVYSAHARYREWRDLYSLGREVPAYLSYAFRKQSDEKPSKQNRTIP